MLHICKFFCTFARFYAIIDNNNTYYKDYKQTSNTTNKHTILQILHTNTTKRTGRNNAVKK
jgi:hypothetical protein